MREKGKRKEYTRKGDEGNGTRPSLDENRHPLYMRIPFVLTISFGLIWK